MKETIYISDCDHENIDIEKIIEQIKGNLLNLGVILND